MKPSRKLGLALLALAAGMLTTGSALAWHHTRLSIGFGFGYPGFGYPYYAPYYYPPAYYPSPVVIQQPPVYVERQDAAPETQNYWYYCAASKTYYPYVKECPAGWQRVPATPPQ